MGVVRAERGRGGGLFFFPDGEFVDHVFFLFTPLDGFYYFFVNEGNRVFN